MTTNEITSLQIPKRWNKFLSKIEDHFPNAIIAGGCLRDLYNEKPIKDIDVFVPYSNISLEELSELTEIPVESMKEKYNFYSSYKKSDILKDVKDELLLFEGYFDDESFHGEEYDNYAEEIVRATASALKKNFMKRIIDIDYGYDFQLIMTGFLNPADYVMGYFDLHGCEIYYDGNTVQASANFIIDHTSDTFTMNPHIPPSDIHKAVVHFSRLKDKYPDYTMVVEEYDPHEFRSVKLSDHDKEIFDDIVKEAKIELGLAEDVCEEADQSDVSEEIMDKLRNQFIENELHRIKKRVKAQKENDWPDSSAQSRIRQDLIDQYKEYAEKFEVEAYTKMMDPKWTIEDDTPYQSKQTKSKNNLDKSPKIKLKDRLAKKISGSWYSGY